MNRLNAAFFGCIGTSGHMMFVRGGQAISDRECVENGLPAPGQLDGSEVFLPQPEAPGVGCCTYLPALDLTVMSWWNRVIDKRPRVNSHFMLRGQISPGIMWSAFNHQFPEVAALHTKPLITVSI